MDFELYNTIDTVFKLTEQLKASNNLYETRFWQNRIGLLLLEITEEKKQDILLTLKNAAEANDTEVIRRRKWFNDLERLR